MRSIASIEKAVDSLTIRITLVLGGLALMGFLFPVIAPLIQRAFGIHP